MQHKAPLETAAVTVSTTSGGMVALTPIEIFNQYAPLLGILLSIVSLGVGIWIHMRNSRIYREQQAKQQQELLAKVEALTGRRECTEED